ncbi:hypothetical protein OS242_10760 [Tumebacillus sp. DT12]|uniref:Uncharacterized protein n=1 Tax=Tumebacillus lacus TaxID=2995335 RepID=A0ABT3X3P4_9BACL|nr:DUF6687 family protein [Tumebacillus lacus]MCX7570442.1 hypothetical protein [Tumebacillus lacus]
MISQFFVLGSQQERPVSRRTIFADGSADKTFREEIDLELSHWVPNRTPERYQANTSTEICLNFVAHRPAGEWDLAINNHFDVDGILSVFSLVHAEYALQHRDILVQAAEMGDFWAWGERPAQILFQGLTLFYNRLRADQTDAREIYEQSFKLVIDLIERGIEAEPAVKEGLDALARSVERVVAGEIERTVYHDRFVMYRIPRHLAEADLGKALHIPTFNAPLADDMWLHPQARHRDDLEKMHLVAVETADGWQYDLHVPGYMWADTLQAWRAPGFAFSGSTNGHYYGFLELEQAVADLQAWETGNGEWTLAAQLSPFASIKGRNYPVILSVIGGEASTVSRLQPEAVAERLADVFLSR